MSSNSNPVFSDNCNSFEELRRSGAVYVDKTDLIADLLNHAARGYQIARPEGFGKSLFVDTLKTFFTKGLEPFAGLKICSIKLRKDLKPTPVVHLDLARISNFETAEEFRSSFYQYLQHELAGLELRDQDGARIDVNRSFEKDPRYPNFALDFLLDKLPFDSLVLLLDNFDAPINATKGRSEELQRRIFGVIEGFFIILKDQSCFLLEIVTGTRVFRDLVGDSIHYFIHSIPTCVLWDLTCSRDGHVLLSFSEEEIAEYFASPLEHTARALNCSRSAVMDKLRLCCPRYVQQDSRRWLTNADTEELTPEYRPQDVLNFFADHAGSLSRASAQLPPVQVLRSGDY